MSERPCLCVCVCGLHCAVKPRFKVKPVNRTAYEGHSVMMHCVAIGDPSPTVLWDKNNRVDALDFRRFKVISRPLFAVLSASFRFKNFQ